MMKFYKFLSISTVGIFAVLFVAYQANGLSTFIPAQFASVDSPADEECYTYEATGSTGEWQSCGAGGASDPNVILKSVGGTDYLAASTTANAWYFDTGFVSIASSTVNGYLNTQQIHASSTSAFDGQAVFYGNINLSDAGVSFSDDGDGALTITGLGDGSDENLILNFDDVSNEIGITSGTGVTLVDFNTIGIDTDSLTVGADTVTSLDGDATLNIVSSALRVIDVTCTGCLGTIEIAGLDISDDTNAASGDGVTVNGDSFDFDCSDVTDSGNDGVSCSTEDIVVGGGRSLTVDATNVDADAELYTSSVAFGIHASSSMSAASSTHTWITPVAITVNGLNCYTSTTGTVTLQVDYASASTSPIGAGTDIFDGVPVCDSNGESDDGRADATVPAGSLIRVSIQAVASSPTDWDATLDFTKDD